eukprot:3455896-Rhodomonas_salina.1
MPESMVGKRKRRECVSERAREGKRNSAERQGPQGHDTGTWITGRSSSIIGTEARLIAPRGYRGRHASRVDSTAAMHSSLIA